MIRGVVSRHRGPTTTTTNKETSSRQAPAPHSFPKPRKFSGYSKVFYLFPLKTAPNGPSHANDAVWSPHPLTSNHTATTRLYLWVSQTTTPGEILLF